jgi:hypothetical protein
LAWTSSSNVKNAHKDSRETDVDANVVQRRVKRVGLCVHAWKQLKVPKLQPLSPSVATHYLAS